MAQDLERIHDGLFIQNLSTLGISSNFETIGFENLYKIEISELPGS